MSGDLIEGYKLHRRAKMASAAQRIAQEIYDDVMDRARGLFEYGHDEDAHALREFARELNAEIHDLWEDVRAAGQAESDHAKAVWRATQR